MSVKNVNSAYLLTLPRIRFCSDVFLKADICSGTKADRPSYSHVKRTVDFCLQSNENRKEPFQLAFVCTQLKVSQPSA
jgi:hypothetical protein